MGVGHVSEQGGGFSRSTYNIELREASWELIQTNRRRGQDGASRSVPCYKMNGFRVHGLSQGRTAIAHLMWLLLALRSPGAECGVQGRELAVLEPSPVCHR